VRYIIKAVLLFAGLFMLNQQIFDFAFRDEGRLFQRIDIVGVELIAVLLFAIVSFLIILFVFRKNKDTMLN